MSLEYARELREERAGLAKQLAELAKLASDEKRDFTPEEAKKFDEIEKRCNELEAQYQRLEKADAARASTDARAERAEHQQWVDKQISQISDDVPTAADMDMAFRGWLLSQHGQQTDRQIDAMRKCGIRSGEIKLKSHAFPFPSSHALPRTRQEVRQAIAQARAEARNQVITRATTAQSITTTGGGNVIGDDNSLIGTLMETILTGGAMRQVATVIQSETGATLPIPLDDVHDKGAILAINTAAVTQDVSIGQTTLGAKKYTSNMVKLPIELIQDASIDIQSWTARKLGERIARITEEHFATGAASLGEPEGLVTTGSSGGAAAGTTASSQAVTLTDLKNLEASLDIGYLPGASWMMHQTLRAHVAGLLDADGRPLWQPAVQLGGFDTIYGYPVVVNNEYATYTNSSAQTAGDKIATFGRHSDYYIRDVLAPSVAFSEHRFFELGQVAVLAFSRHDGQYINAAVTNTTNASIKTMVASAS